VFFGASISCRRVLFRMKKKETDKTALGGVGGASPTRKMRGVTAVEMIAKIRICNNVIKLERDSPEQQGRQVDLRILSYCLIKGSKAGLVHFRLGWL